MAWRIPEDTINELRDRLSIVDVVSTYVSLKKQGRNHLGLCPFHAEKSPSFTVNEERGFFHCFGCGAGGSVFTFVMQQERVEFREALEMLAKRIGFTLPAPEADERAANERERLTKLNGWAAKRFTEALWGRDGAGAREYLEKRGVSEEIARRFGLGYAPPAGDFLSGGLGAKREALAAAARLGLVGQRDQGGGAYDRFRSRLMFPIKDARGEMIAFGGRALGEVQPKYLNSPESPLFRKSEVLYALPDARDEIRKRDEAIVVEGYLDALALIQFDIANAIATLGTALTPQHLKVLSRLAKRIVMFFDGDNAGRKAATRAFAVCCESGIWAHGAFLPEGEDPDTFVRARGAEAVRELIAAAQPLSDFYFQQLLTSAGTETHGRALAAQEASQVLQTVADPIERDLLLQTAARRLGVSEQALRSSTRRAPVRAAPPTSAPPEAPAQPRPIKLEPRAELILLESMAADEGIARAVALRGVLDHFRNPELAAAAREIADAWGSGRNVGTALERLPPAISARLSASLLGAEIEYDERLKMAEDCVGRIELEAGRPVREANRRETLEAAAANDEDREREALRRIRDEQKARKGR